MYLIRARVREHEGFDKLASTLRASFELR